MDNAALVALLDRYFEEVYVGRDPEAARRFIADPCLRHEHGELITLSLDDNVARIAAFQQQFPSFTFTEHVRAVGDDVVTTVFDMDLGGGTVLSGVEVFRVVDGLIAETWNTEPAPGAWG